MGHSEANHRRAVRRDDEPSSEQAIHENEIPRPSASPAPREDARISRKRVRRLKWPWPSEMVGD